MEPAGRQRAFGALIGWWATAARALAFVLALAVAVPAAGLAEDASYHRGHQGPDRAELVMLDAAASAGERNADPGLGCHLHCGCHVAAPVDGTVSVPPPPSRPRYARVVEAVATVVLDRVPRPPRA